MNKTTTKPHCKHWYMEVSNAKITINVVGTIYYKLLLKKKTLQIINEN